ncbi:MAG: hypothetical protein M2R45_02760 [Verrucomicrobia subdivision 3 bacterium]|nr:hypothetical protein [Limisphaerales bacterium]MCS1414309.1 hypothetical protein [Limisphaerales bacterium]
MTDEYNSCLGMASMVVWRPMDVGLKQSRFHAKSRLAMEIAHGTPLLVLPDICEAVLKSREAGALKK